MIEAIPTREDEIRTLEKRMSGGGQAGRLRQRVLRAHYRTVRSFARVSKRFADVVLASFLLFVLAPLFAVLLVVSHGRFDRVTRLGRWAEPFELLSFALPGSGPLAFLRRFGCQRIAGLINILRGHLSWIGPRPLIPSQVRPEEQVQWRRWDVRPGVLSLWWIRKRANNHFGTEWEADAEYVQGQSMTGDAGLAARALPALLYGESAEVADDVISILGVRIDNMTMTEALNWIQDRVARRAPGQVRFLNADCANRAWLDTRYRGVLNGPGLTLPDGIGLKLAGKILGRGVRQNVNGTDLFPRLCALLAEKGHSLYLLGARPGVAEAVAEWAKANFAGLLIAGARDGYFSPLEDEAVIDEIAASGAGLLLVAFGAPRQDTWIAERLLRLGVPVAAGVGGLFDFYSGRIPRAPQWMRDMAIEWLYRFWQEPRRMWRRYFVGNFVFLFRVAAERLGRRTPVLWRVEE